MSIPEVFSPMLTVSSLEATISECSLEIKPSQLVSPKTKERLVILISIVFIICIPLIFFFTLVYEHKQFDPSNPANRNKPVPNGVLKSAVTSCGPVQGVAKDGGFEFLGIPYAIPPGSKMADKDGVSKNFRWEPGTNPFKLEHCWEGELKYPQSKPQECLQTISSPDGKVEVVGSEDCLTLDIYTPTVGYDTPSPVVVVVAVPSLIGGWPDKAFHEQVTPTAKLAFERGVVFVVPRFRLGPTGFLPRLLLNDTSDVVRKSADFTDAVQQAKSARLQLDKSYNLGLTDITAALIWVQNNIDHFSGDSSVVTLLGWAAGADLVTALTATRPPKGHSFLFTQSWVTGGGNSTSMSSTSNQHDIKKSDKNRAHLSFDLGYQLWANSPCNQSRYDPLCLLSLPAETLMASVPTSWLSSDHIWLQPDRFWFQKTAADAWSTGDIAQDFPLVMGSTLHSAAGLSPDCMTIESQIAGDTDHLLSSIAEPSVRRIINNFYKNASTFYSRVALLTDSHSICPSLDLAKKAAHAFSSSVYYYVASFEEPVTCSNGTTPLHLAHSLSDISAILGRHSSVQGSDAVPFVSQMQNIFYSFVADGSLPGRITVGHGLYDVKQSVSRRSGYPACAIWH